MRFSPENLDQAGQMLVSGVGRTEAKSGCHECVVSQDKADQGHIRYCEAWESQAAFQQHIQSEEFRRVLVAMDMCCEEPHVVIGDLSGHRGIAYLQELHNSSIEGSEST